MIGGAPVKVDSQVTRTSNDQAKPEASAPNQTGEQPTITLPPEPIEPYLITTAQGPFMILAYTFRSPYAAKYAQALAMELRQTENLPAYVYYMRIQPGGSNIRNIPPTAPGYVRTGTLTPPERYRSYDEAAVLVGNYPTIDDAEGDLKRVKKLRPQTLSGTHSIWASADPRARRQGLSRAIVTQNPLVAAQRLYPGRKDLPVQPGSVFDPFVMTTAVASAPKVDPLVKRLNQGPRSLFQCPGPYTMVVAEFGGRSTLNPADPRFRDDRALQDSPLRTAHEDAETLAEVLSSSSVIRQSGHKVYVFHDRSSSKVCIGAFQTETDPAVASLRDLITRQVELFKAKDGQVSLVKFEPTVLDRFRGNKGEFFHLTPSPTLLAVPKE
jgi:hypothetical protein